MVNTADLKSAGINLEGSSPSTPILIQLAANSNHHKHRHAAIILHDGQVVAWSNNTSNEHAETRALTIAAIHGYKKNLILISIAITKEGKLKLAKPCISCQWACKRRGVRKIYYSTRKQTIIKMEEQ